jgi:hypothetical protein
MVLIDSEEQQNQDQEENKDPHRAATASATCSNSVTYCTHFISSFANGIPSLPCYAALLENVTKTKKTPATITTNSA